MDQQNLDIEIAELEQGPWGSRLVKGAQGASSDNNGPQYGDKGGEKIKIYINITSRKERRNKIKEGKRKCENM